MTSHTPRTQDELAPPLSRPGSGRVVLRRDLGPFADPAPRPLARRPLVTAAQPLLRPLSAVVCVETSDPVVALTFDDGPDPQATPGLLDVLAEHRRHATFFVLSEAAERHPGIVRRIVAEGHELALHSRDHRRRLSQVPYHEAMEVVAASRAVVERIGGVPVHLFRPPYGAHTVRQRLGWARQGLRVLLWSGSAEDWYHGTEDELVDRAVRAVHPGAVLLFHDTRADPETAADPATVPHFDRSEVLDRFLVHTTAQGVRTSTAGRLLAAYPPVRAVMRDMMG
ncbi:polysaccharide deacetylase family protein [Cellulomonas hominis]|uniref:polysaccharide deacetylase family protein n=1 Tax=Cellulomonas hominis TaxID=156981 RepID=UPI001443964E|nr:polysaccharide deacetylase family protein [Cellulomonas hominis]NKY09178.1 polysaccharide deacetylase family protein [Cellulomonas hominis]